MRIRESVRKRRNITKTEKRGLEREEKGGGGKEGTGAVIEPPISVVRVRSSRTSRKPG